MSEALLNAGRQTLMLELQEASRLPERLGDDFVRAANIILHCEGKVVVSELANRATLVRKSPQRLPVPAHRLFLSIRQKHCTAIWG